MIHEFRKPIPVVVEGDSEGYAIYVESGCTFENDIWCVVHCLGGIVRHYRSDQIRIHASGTFDIKKG
jgi:tRNA G37 N-methylase Trm5